MSTSLLYHGFGVRDQDYLKTEYRSGTVVFHIKTKDSKLKCSDCGSSYVRKKGVVPREFRTYSIGMKPVYLHIDVQRLECLDCGLIRQETLNFADEKKDIQEVLNDK